MNYIADTNEITIDELYMRNNTLICKMKNVDPEKYKRIINPKWHKFVFRFRKYWLFLISNAFVDGKIFDMKALKMELKNNEKSCNIM